jgi:DNA polymerase I-like protein with 3'-5' exonuclease and polymerase domains
MVGKAPYYTPTGTMKIDNIYLSVMSVSPMGSKLVRELFNGRYNGQSFQTRWIEPAFQDEIKAQIKKEYALHKIGALGLSYGMRPRKFQAVAYDAGYSITMAQAEAFFNTYWNLFSGVKTFSDKCAAAFKLRGCLINDFGYRLVPDKAPKAFNYFIQSSVSGILHVICADFFIRAPYCTFLLVIHDEVIFGCPAERVEEARTAMKASEDALNTMLNWRVKVRIGFKVGDSLYTAK